MAANRRGLEIRAASSADAPRLAGLLAEAGPAPARLAGALEALAAGRGAALLAEEGGPPSGLIVLHWLEPLCSGRVALVSTLRVAADARRRGVGRLLLKAGAQAARAAGCEALQLFAPPDTPDLDAFCRESGFEACGALWSRRLRKRA